MEVMGSSSQLKESKAQTPEINFNSRLPRDVNVGVNPGAKGKGEADVNLLVACKVQLSSEVIRWKTETLRLQKERDSAQIQTKELDQELVRMRERARELEERLMQAEDENRHLKSTSFNSEKERAYCNVVQRLSHSSVYNKCSSLESSVKPELSRLQALESRKYVVSPQEDWREVSQKMLQQMRNEMKEMAEMNVHCYPSEKETVQDSSSEVGADCKEEVKIELSNLLCEAQTMKQQFLDQRLKLESILQNVISGGLSRQDQMLLNKSRDTDSLYADVQNSASPNSRRMSAEDYRLHFSKQLENTSDPKKMARKVQHFLTNPDLCILQKDLEEPLCPPDIAEEASEIKTEDSEKVCPICQITFRASVSQADFEEHVVNHLERESASLLDQYVIV